jgi:arylsulfatase A-like enzyme
VGVSVRGPLLGTGRTRIRLLALVILASLAVSACRRSAPQAPLRAIAHLASERYQSAGDPSTANVPTAMIGGERRPVLSNSTRTVLFATIVPAGVDRATVRVPVPERLRGARFRLFTSVTEGATVVEQKPVVASLHPPEQRMRVAVSRPDGNPAYLVIEGRPVPEERYEAPPLAVPPEARLRFAIGVDASDPAAATRGVNFQVTAIDGEQERILFRITATSAESDRRGWSDQEVSLARYAGRRIRLRFESSGPGGLDPASLYPLWSDPTVVAPEPTGRRFRNAILISLDTLRPDHLGCYGYHRPTSPTIDAVLAGRGTLFERAYTHFPGTAGSHMTLMTSLLPCVHGLLGGGPISNQKPRADVHLLSELLRSAGYRTAAFTEDGYVTAGTGFARGFDTFVERTTKTINVYRGQADATLRDALAWIRTQGDGPWFTFVHTYQVHHPYTPPPGYLDEILADEDVAADAPLSAALYDGEIRYTDDLLAEFLAGVDAIPGGSETLIVVIADHGEQFGEHGYHFHGNSLYDVLLHVPLIVRAPGLVPAGRRVAAPVGLIDVAPTVLDLLGLPPPSWTQGRSLVPLLADGGSLPPSKLYANLPLLNLVAIRSGNLKWIINQQTGASMVFDIVRDPGEMHELSETTSAVPLLREYEAACAAPPPPPAPAETEPVDPAVQEKLKALGYID